MRLILGKLKELVGHKSRPDMLEYRLNRVFERAITSGKWNGTMHTLGLACHYGELALPRYYRTVNGVKVDGYVRDITNRWWEFLPGKADAYGYTLEYVRDLGDAKPTMYSLPLGGRGYKTPPTATVVSSTGAGCQLQVQTKAGMVVGIDIIATGSGYLSTDTVSFSADTSVPPTGFGANAILSVQNGQVTNVQLVVKGTMALSYPVVGPDPGLTMTIYGVDQNFMPVTLTLTGNGSTAANPFSSITRIHKEQGDVVLTLTHTSFDGQLITPLAFMEPGEEETFYRRYSVDTLALTHQATISAFCKLRHIELTNDQDIVPFSNITAIEAGLDWQQYLSESDKTLAGQYFQDMIDALNSELEDTKAVDEVPSIRFRFPGNTQPKFKGFM